MNPRTIITYLYSLWTDTLGSFAGETDITRADIITLTLYVNRSSSFTLER